MSFDYDKLKAKEEHSNFWVAYSDLFTVLSAVFLLLYVTASLKSGTAGIQQRIEYQRLEKRAEELEQQIKVYTTLKDEQLEQASEDEQQVYQTLMEKLSLLKDEAKNEKEDLRRQARENEKKEFALNQYQQIIRNIIDTNILAKAQIKRREEIINVKDKNIREKRAEISKLSADVASKESQINEINAELAKRISQLNNEQKRAKITKTQMNKAIAKLKQDSAARIQAIEAQSQEAIMSAREELENSRARYAAQMERLRAEHNANMAKAQAEFNEGLRKQQLSAQAKAAKLAAFKAEAERKSQELEGKLSDLAGKVKDAEGQLAATTGQLAATKGKLAATAGQLAAAEQDKSRYIASLESAEKEKSALEGDLKRVKELAFARQNMAKQIALNFQKAGVPAQVDPKTGDVTLSFGDDYFSSGSAQLTPTMEKALNKFIPAYADGLFSNPEIANQLANVEIIGFASSTYKGRYVKPNSLNPQDQEAINYNLKLSFSRANAIFNHVFNPKKLTYKHQKTLLPYVKLVGRGFLPEGRSPAEIPDGLSDKEFCKRYNCEKAQRVIVKFNLKD